MGVRSSSSTFSALDLQFLTVNFAGFKALRRFEYCIIWVSSSSLNLSELDKTSLSAQFLKAKIILAFFSKVVLPLRYFSTPCFCLFNLVVGAERLKELQEKRRAINSSDFKKNGMLYVINKAYTHFVYRLQKQQKNSLISDVTLHNLIESTYKTEDFVKLKALSLGFFVSFFGSFVFAQNALVEVSVKLSPVGSYVAKTNQVQGSAKVVGTKIQASDIKVQTKSLKTGIALRDKHTQERLMADKFPEIILVKGEGDGGKGTGIIKLKGIEKPIAGTYQVEGKMVKAQFKLSIKQFGIENVKYLGVGVKDEVEIKVQLPIVAN